MSTRTLVTVFAIPLLALAACSREKSDWRSAEAADSPESYQQFITEHPESTQVTKARERLQQLAEEKDWRSAAVADTLEGYQQFLAQYPTGKWAKEAQVRLDNFANAAAVPDGVAPDIAAAPPPAAGAVPPPDAMLPSASAEGAGGFGVQLGAFSSAERANAEWTRLQGDAGGTLDGLAPRVVVGEAGGKPIYRLQAHVRDEAQARAVCGGLQQASHPCVVVPPPPGP